MHEHWGKVRVESVGEVAPNRFRVEFSGLDSRRIIPGYRNSFFVSGAYVTGSWPICVGDVIEVSSFAIPDIARRNGRLIWVLGPARTPAA